MKYEQEHFQGCREVIRENIRLYEQKIELGRKETEELYSAVTSGDVELYNQLIVSKDLLSHNENMLKKNKAAYEKPYFGRVDYTETENGQRESLYIGKNGVSRDRTETLIVDWRAPVATLYYENELGEGSYEVPDEGTVNVLLKLKRTFDVSGGKLLGYFDNDAAATDELLIKYLSQNKDAVLGDIISTIQKEQNEIIRESPFLNVIVQGVAGSGKTTVAMHRISYILYNYEKRFRPSEFLIIGSNDMLLHYITSGLPELDVHDVGQKRMDILLQELLCREWKKNFRISEMDSGEAYKSRMDFVMELDTFLSEQKARLIPQTDIVDARQGILFQGRHIADTLRENPGLSVFQLQKLLNERLKKRIAFLVSDEEETNRRKELKKQYQGYFKMEKQDKSLVDLYDNFLRRFQKQRSLPVTGQKSRTSFHIYDLAALVLIYKRILAKESADDYSQVIIDEAQDFGAMVYYVLKQTLAGCHFTVMGDVSQNINYETGMNTWDEMRQYVFAEERMRFHILAKSYRNTIEISEYAGNILDAASFGVYKITPVIRHGREVAFYRTEGGMRELAEKTKGLIKEIAERGYETAAVICRDEAEVQAAADLLGIVQEKCFGFTNRVMVLSVKFTKGLEFDAVILWNPCEPSYGNSGADAKLLYVAVTRALHELHIVYDGRLPEILLQHKEK